MLTSADPGDLGAQSDLIGAPEPMSTEGRPVRPERRFRARWRHPALVTGCLLFSWPGLAAADQAGLVRIIRRKLKKIQYQPLVDGCLVGAGLKADPW